jgi:hypothetical protein
VELLLLVDPAASDAARATLDAKGGHVTQTYGSGAWIVEVAETAVESLRGARGVRGAFTGDVPPDMAHADDEIVRLAIAAWNARHAAGFRAAKRERRGEGRPWDDPEFEREG